MAETADVDEQAAELLARTDQFAKELAELLGPQSSAVVSIKIEHAEADEKVRMLLGCATNTRWYEVIGLITELLSIPLADTGSELSELALRAQRGAAIRATLGSWLNPEYPDLFDVDERLATVDGLLRSFLVDYPVNFPLFAARNPEDQGTGPESIGRSDNAQ